MKMYVESKSRLFNTNKDDPNYNKFIWSKFSKEVDLPQVPNVGDILRMSFEEDHRQHDICVLKIRYVEYSTTFGIEILCKEIIEE